MTPQTKELLIYNGDRLFISSMPLKPYLDNLKEQPIFYRYTTGCWRGYKGTWEIIENKLFLIDLFGNTRSGIVGLDFLFPNEEKVFASWFTGQIKIPQGRMIGYSNNYESYQTLDFKKGFLKINSSPKGFLKKNT
ncbi:hypothetical protein NF867_09355 [Solitalea sp. MAHUQ-68]|uniref:WG repeat-containing protein n=1 Tax=Solitalea agri TaxID=2953739 RepID=A0A9X2F1Q5_9SPHI|nr:hypothetical protein [Solitalea agri]MCO4293069.1 hypothetical protein [Solitalea agri]